MTLINDMRDRYHATMAFYKSAGYGNAVDQIWTDNMSMIMQIINECPSAEQAIDAIDRTYLYSINFPQDNSADGGNWKIPGDTPHVREFAVDWLLRNQKQMGVDIFAMPAAIQESACIHPRNQVKRNGRVLSGNFLRTLSCLKQMQKYLDLPQRPRVLELGAGCGHQARTFALFYPGCRYLITDLPETLCFSYMYLRLNFPDKTSLFVTNERELQDMDKYDFVFLPAAFAGHLAGQKFDLFVNTASLGEMRNDVIAFWMDMVQNKARIASLFTLNRYLNTIYPEGYGFRLNENRCSLSYDSNWTMINWELEPSYTRCPYMDTLHARYVEVAAQRTPPADKEARSKQLLREVLAEDWLRVEKMHNGGIMTSRDNVMVHDMTMTGTLFKLWESLRLHPTREAIEVMLKYLDRLICQPQQGKAFEEAFYYRDYLKTWPNKPL